MAGSLNKLVDSLVKQGSHKEGTHVLPHWITDGAKLAYFSERSGKAFDVVIDGISHSKQQVRFVFADDRKVWKSVTFQEILAGRNPLRKREKVAKLVVAPGKEVDPAEGKDEKDELDTFLSSMEEKWDSKSSAKKRRDAEEFGPTLKAKVPLAWEKPDDIDSSSERAPLDIASSPEPIVQDLDAKPPTPTQEELDPYGLGEACGDRKGKVAATYGEHSQDQKTRKLRERRPSTGSNDGHADLVKAAAKDGLHSKDQKTRKIRQRKQSSGSNDAHDASVKTAAKDSLDSKDQRTRKIRQRRPSSGSNDAQDEQIKDRKSRGAARRQPTDRSPDLSRRSRSRSAKTKGKQRRSRSTSPKVRGRERSPSRRKTRARKGRSSSL